MKSGLELLMPSLAVVLAAYGLSLLLNDAVTWSNPEYLVFSVPGAMDGGPGVSWKDLAKAFDPLTFDVVRPRFLNYLITALNVKFRLALYEYFIPPVNLSLMLFVTVVFSPLLLFLTLRNLVSSKSIACSVTCLYITSVGFLSTCVWFVQPGKILIHPMTMLLVWVLSTLQKRDGEKYFSEHSPRLVGLIFTLNLISLSVDDTYAITAAVACVLFWRLFIPRQFVADHIKRAGVAVFVFWVPFAVFFLFVWAIAPQISAAVGAGPCDYIGSALSQSASSVKTPYLLFLRDLSLTALAGTLLPHPFPADMSPIFLKLKFARSLVVVAVLAAVMHLAYTRRRAAPGLHASAGVSITDALIALVVYFVVQAVVQRIHPLITAGYYYASLTSIFVSILCALVIANLRASMQVFGQGVVLVLVVFQLANFVDLNERWKLYHVPTIPYSLSKVRTIYPNVVEDGGLPPTPEQRQRIDKIWHEWKGGRRVDLTGEPAWPAMQAWFLVEINALSGFVYRDPVRRCNAKGGAS